MSLIGTTLGQYRIDAEAGRGGMGVVYRATDTQLGRAVAIKVLRPDAVADEDRKKRFIQEAKSASALNHPGIVTVYQIGAQGATDFIAMEFVAGRSLDSVVGKRPLPAADVVRYGAQIADALAAAHTAGLVHRDLKPANVMITEKGQIKLLDFGVAKLVERVEPGPSDATMTRAPETQCGAIVGTVAYMSPEQAQGAAIDRRSDIFSFGVMLQEMLTGRKPSAIADDTSLAKVPRDLQRIVRCCLQTDPARRFQATDDLRIALEEADLGPRTDAAPPSRSNRLLTMGAVAVAATAMGTAIGWALFRERPAPALVLRRLTLDSSFIADLAISRDGRFIAYASDRDGGNLDIWAQQVAGGGAVRLTTDRADDEEPSFSPDGSQIVFRSQRDGGGLYVVSTLGSGDARLIADRGRRPRWSPDGRYIVYWTGRDTAFLMTRANSARAFVVAASGGEPREIATDLTTAWAPIWNADSTHVLLLGSRDDSPPDWWIASIDGGVPVRTGSAALLARFNLTSQPDSFFLPEAWMADGHVIFSARLGDSTNIWKLDVGRTGTVAGAPVRVTSGAGVETRPAVDAGQQLVFSSLTSNIDLWSLPTDTLAAKATGPMTRLSDDAARDAYPSFTPDGSALVFLSNRSGSYDLWVRDMTTGKESMLAARAAFPSLPVVSKDGRRVYFHSGDRRLFSVPLSGPTALPSSASDLVCDGCNGIWDVSEDGKWSISPKPDDTAIFAREIATGRTTELLQAPGEILARLRISPNDRWVSFSHRAPGIIQQAIAPFRPGASIPRTEWIDVTPPEEEVSAVSAWSSDSRRLYYLSSRDGHLCLWARSIDEVTGPSGEPIGVWHFHDAQHSAGRIQLPFRSIAMARDRIVILLAESRSAVWLATPTPPSGK